MAVQQNETIRLCAALDEQVATVRTSVEGIDTRLQALTDLVDNANKQSDDMERKVEKVSARIGFNETIR